MIFLLVRILPFFLPLLLFIFGASLFYWIRAWPIFLMVILLLNLTFFIFFAKKFKRPAVWLIFFHSLAVVMVGAFYFLLLSNPWIVRIFLIFWSLLYAVYLESIFHYFYQTQKAVLIELKNIIFYTGLMMAFIVGASFINAYIFLNFSGWPLVLLLGLIFFILTGNNLIISGFDFETGLLYATVVAGLAVELAVALLFAPVSFYVSAMILAGFYYLSNVLAVASFKQQLTTRLFAQEIIFVGFILVITLTTASWL